MVPGNRSMLGSEFKILLVWSVTLLDQWVTLSPTYVESVLCAWMLFYFTGISGIRGRTVRYMKHVEGHQHTDARTDVQKNNIA